MLELYFKETDFRFRGLICGKESDGNLSINLIDNDLKIHTKLAYMSIGIFGEKLNQAIKDNFNKLKRKNCLNFCKQVLQKGSEESDAIGGRFQG